MMFKSIENWALHTFADGELEPDDRKGIQKFLSESVEAQKTLAAINFQKAALHKAFDGALNEPVPAALMAAANGRPSRWALPYLIAACIAGLLVIGGGFGWFAGQNNGQVLTASLAQRALVAHETFASEVRHPVEVAASEQDHLQAWLSKRVGSDFKIPDLQKDGYTLLGGRLLAETETPAGQLMYEAADKQRVTIYFTSNSSGKQTDLKLEQKDKLITCYWRDAKLAIAVTGDMSADAMTVLGSSIFAQVEGRHGVYER